MGQIRPIRTFFSYWPTLTRPILVFRILSRFYIRINDKIETLCHCRQMGDYFRIGLIISPWVYQGCHNTPTLHQLICNRESTPSSLLQFVGRLI